MTAAPVGAQENAFCEQGSPAYLVFVFTCRRDGRFRIPVPPQPDVSLLAWSRGNILDADVVAAHLRAYFGRFNDREEVEAVCGWYEFEGGP